jgi:hypothetical protein
MLPQFRTHRPLPEHTPASLDLDIVEFSRQRLGFDPDPVQELVLRSNAPRGILNCTRQWGKTTVTVAMALHRVYTVPKTLVIVASPSGRQSGEWMNRAAEMLPQLGIRKHGDGYNDISLLFPNGSRIVGLPESEAKNRGFASPSLIIIDEAARVTDASYRSLRTLLSVGNGDLWMLSTPWGKQGFFYETWAHDQQFFRISVPATECPRISPAFLEEQRSVMGAASFGQEHMCEFVGSGCAVFDRDLIEAAFDDNVKPI